MDTCDRAQSRALAVYDIKLWVMYLFIHVFSQQMLLEQQLYNRAGHDNTSIDEMRSLSLRGSG